jgi:DNA-directed RNA polymerase I subunit RPA1
MMCAPVIVVAVVVVVVFVAWFRGVKEWMVTTEGVNFAAAWRLTQFLDINALGSNDIAAILRTYGVEAARHSIVSQVSAVFNAYGIAVDVRHLSLIADYMTFQGGFRPMNRLGMESNTSPWLKMTFETCLHFMSSAAEYAHVKRNTGRERS